MAALDRRAIAALITAAIVGIAVNEFGTGDAWLALAPSRDNLDALWRARLHQTAALAAIYVVAPLLVAAACGVGPLALGLRLGETTRWARRASLFVAVALPIAFALSFLPGFTHLYPVFKPSLLGGRALWLWLPLQAATLWCVEFFYRGFLLTMLQPALGRLALFVMIVPYALTHRDPIEATGAIGVGLLLGWLALASRSIWLSWLVHASVACFLEVVAVWQSQRG